MTQSTFDVLPLSRNREQVYAEPQMQEKASRRIPLHLRIGHNHGLGQGYFTRNQLFRFELPFAYEFDARSVDNRLKGFGMRLDDEYVSCSEDAMHAGVQSLPAAPNHGDHGAIAVAEFQELPKWPVGKGAVIGNPDLCDVGGEIRQCVRDIARTASSYQWPTDQGQHDQPADYDRDPHG